MLEKRNEYSQNQQGIREKSKDDCLGTEKELRLAVKKRWKERTENGRSADRTEWEGCPQAVEDPRKSTPRPRKDTLTQKKSNLKSNGQRKEAGKGD